jgi:hypothetical protein
MHNFGESKVTRPTVIDSAGIDRRAFFASTGAMLATLATGYGQTSYSAVSGQRVRDCLWLWGTLPNVHEENVKKLSTITAVEAANYLGVKNMIMGGGLLPSEAAAQLVSSFRRVLWKLESYQGDFAAELAAIHSLAAKHDNIEATMVDDLTSTAISKNGMGPQQIAKVAYALQLERRPLTLWGTVYTMNLGLPTLKNYLNLLNVVDLWSWRASDIPQFKENFERCEELSGGKPTTLGLYLFDFGDGRPMPVNLMEAQCNLALDLLKAKRIFGAVFLSSAVCDLGFESVKWVKQWIATVGDQMLPPVF